MKGGGGCFFRISEPALRFSEQFTCWIKIKSSIEYYVKVQNQKQYQKTSKTSHFSDFKNVYMIKNDKVEFLKRVQSITGNYELKPKSN